MRLITIAKRKRAQSCILKLIAFLAVLAISGLPQSSEADEGGVSFWMLGFRSLAATPLQPGFSLATIYYHTPVIAGADRCLRAPSPPRPHHDELHRQPERQPDADADLDMWAVPSYVFEEPFLGGQAALCAGALRPRQASLCRRHAERQSRPGSAPASRYPARAPTRSTGSPISFRCSTCAGMQAFTTS